MTVSTGHEADAEPASLVSFIDLNPETEDFLEAVLNGLSCDQKELPCKFFYDERGSRLFDQICDLEEYYPTRTEIGILQDRLGEIAELSDTIGVQTKEGCLEILRLQPPGKKAMATSDYLRGAGKKWEIGDPFGRPVI